MRSAWVWMFILISFGVRTTPCAAESYAVRTPEQVYLSACATCHGVDGSGTDPEISGLDLEPPDFTDCVFASREPDADWVAVAHQGGPVRVFDRMMPAFGDTLDVAALELAMAHIRTFCRKGAWPRGELNLPLAMFTGKAFPEDEAVFRTGASLESPGSIQSRFVYERRLGPRNQWEIVIPFASREDAGGGWQHGLGDVAFAVKRALYHSLDQGAIFSLTVEGIFPTGSEDKGLGSGTTVIEPFATFGKILPSDGFLQAQVGAGLPFDRDRAGREGFARIALGKSFVQGTWGRTWSPMVEVLAARPLEDGATTHWDIVPQFQVTLSKRQHVMANIALRVPVNDAGPRATQIFTYLLWDWFDGPFTAGW
jgi:hypothetical protein